MNLFNPKIINNKQEFQRNVVEAVKILANPVKATLGPDGQPILLERESLPPLATKDGVTVAREVHVADPSLRTIIEAIKEAAQNTNTKAGDGTTSSILLTEAFILNSQACLLTNALTPQNLADQLQSVSAKICEEVSNFAEKINSKAEHIRNVALISSNGDEEIASAVIEAIDTVGEDGLITLEEGGYQPTNLRIEEGFSINRGYRSFDSLGFYLINSRSTQESIHTEAAVLAYNGILDSAKELGECVQRIYTDAKGETRSFPLIILAHDFSPPVMELIVQNVRLGTLKALPIKVPSLGAKYSQAEALQDLAVLTGGKVIHPDKKALADIRDSNSEFLGGVEKVVGGQEKTMIFGGKGDPEEIKARTQELKDQMAKATSDWEKDIFKERISRLVGSIAVIEVGGATEFEVKEKKDRIEDALCATRAALESGVVPGGGTALLKAYKNYVSGIDVNALTLNDRIVLEIIQKVSEAPIRQITQNTGKVSPDVAVFRVIANLDEFPNYGYDARNKRYVEDMIESGIIDPVKVVTTALTNAVSIASTLLRSGGSIVLSPVKNKKEDDFYSPVNPDPSFMP